MADIVITPIDLNLPVPGQAPNWAPQLNNEIEKLASWVEVNVEDIADRVSPLDSEEVRFDQFPTRTAEVVSINNRTYSVSAVATFPNGDYVAVWYNEDRHPIVGKRYASSGAWETRDLHDIYSNPLASPAIADGHNSLVVAIDGEGFIHVLGNMHANPMRYVRSAVAESVTGGWVVIDPADWPVTISYPWIRTLDNGELLMFYREGGSYLSAWWLRRYNPTSKSWGTPIHIMEGRYVTPTMGGYPNSLIVDGDTLHLFYMWRGDSTEASNRDFAYLRSDNLGATWTRIDGTTQTMPVTPATVPPRIYSGPTGFMNQSGAAVVNGRPHAIVRETTEAQANIRWIYWDGSAWQNRIVTSAPVGMLGRPALAATSDGILVALYRYGDQSIMRRLLPEVSGPVELFPLPSGSAEAGWEPAFDAGLLDQAGVLRMIVSSTASATSNTASVTPSNGGWGGVLTVRLTDDVITGLLDERPQNAVSPPVALPPSSISSERVVPPWNVPGMTSTIRPWYVIGGSARVTTSVPRMPVGYFYGSRCMFPKQARIGGAAVRVAAGDSGAQVQIVVVELDALGRDVNVMRSVGKAAGTGTNGSVLEFNLSGFSVHPGRVYLVGAQVFGGTLGVALVGSAEHDPYISWDTAEGHLSANNNKFPGYREIAGRGSSFDSPVIGSLEPSTITPLVALRFEAPSA